MTCHDISYASFSLGKKDLFIYVWPSRKLLRRAPFFTFNIRIIHNGSNGLLNDDDDMAKTVLCVYTYMYTHS